VHHVVKKKTIIVLFLPLPVHRNVFLSGKLSGRTNHHRCYIPLWWRYTSVVKVAINYYNSLCLKRFTATSFGSCIRCRCMVEKLLQEGCHVKHVTSLYTVYVCCWDINYDILKSGFGSLEDACWPLVPKFAGSNPAEAFGFFRAKKSPARLPSEGK
jgi:hypothetical protein